MNGNVTCRLMRGALLALLLAGIVNYPARGQGVAVGRIKGSVRDQSGDVVAGASVVARGELTGIETKTVSNTAGEYVFEGVPIGSYILTVGISGFQTEVRTAVRVVSGETRTMDFTLAVGQVTQTVTVNAAPPILNTTGNTVGTTRVTEEISALPYALAGQRGRSATGALLTVSGINYNPDEAQSKPGYVVGRAKINGAPRSQVGYYQDGVFSAAVGHELTEEFVLPIPEEVAEVRLMTSQNAEYGWNSGTGYSLTFKSGTNQLHGSLFEYLRNTALDARNWFGRTRDVNKQNDFGGVVGGPVVIPKIYNGKDRTFFFVSYDGFRFRQGAAGTTTTVPTAAMRSGDFRELLGPQTGTDVLGRPVFRGAIYDPLTTRSDGRGGFVRDPFAYNGQLNVIDPGRLSAISKFFQAGYPLPTRPGTQNNWVGLPPAVRTQTDMFKGKIDEVINSNHRFSFSWGNALRSSDLDRGDNGFGRVINPAQDNIESEYRYRFNYYWTIRSNLLFELSSGIVRTPNRDSPPTYPEQRTGGTAAGLKGTISHYTPSTSIESWTGFGISATRSRSIDQGNSANASLIWVKGAHVLKFGAQFQFVELYRVGDGGTGGSFSFRYLETSLPGQSTTGAGYASFLLGEVNSATLSSFNQFNRSMQGGWGFFVQDQWRVTPKLTLNYGLRWNLFVPTRIGGDAIGTFDPNLPNPGAGGRLGALTFWGNGPGAQWAHQALRILLQGFRTAPGFCLSAQFKDGRSGVLWPYISCAFWIFHEWIQFTHCRLVSQRYPCEPGQWSHPRLQLG